MIKKMLVCDRCKSRLAELIIPVTRSVGTNLVLCEECARFYYDVIDVKLKCENCGKIVEIGQKLYTFAELSTPYFCSAECVLSFTEHCNAHRLTEEEVKALIEKGETTP